MNFVNRWQLIYSTAASGMAGIADNWSLVFPVIAKSNEAAHQATHNRWEITKLARRLMVSSDAPIERIPSRRERGFNLVPGFEAVPLQLVSQEMTGLNLVLKISS